MNFQLQDVSTFINWPYPTPNSNGAQVLLYGNDKHNSMVQIGTSIGKRNDRLQFSYSFEKRKYKDSTLIYSRAERRWFLYKLDVKHTVHRFGVTAKLLDKANLKWMTTFHASAVTGNFNMQGLQGTSEEAMLTGGWINRFQYKKIIVGLDISYLTGQNEGGWGIMVGGDGEGSYENIYAGYRIQLGNNTLELYAATRNPGKRNASPYPDRRNYFGLGGKLEL
jgi:hypothetical protein